MQSLILLVHGSEAFRAFCRKVKDGEDGVASHYRKESRHCRRAFVLLHASALVDATGDSGGAADDVSDYPGAEFGFSAVLIPAVLGFFRDGDPLWESAIGTKPRACGQVGRAWHIGSAISRRECC